MTSDHFDEDQSALPPAPSSSGFRFDRLLRVIYAPRTTLAEVRENPQWLIPYVGSFVVAAIGLTFMIQIMLAQSMEIGMEKSLEEGKDPTQIEQIESMLDAIEGAGTGLKVLGAVLFALFGTGFSVVVALVLHLLVRAAGGERVVLTLAAFGFSGWIGALGTIPMGIMISQTGDALTTTLSPFAMIAETMGWEKMSRNWLTLSQSTGVFAIWSYFILFIGLEEVVGIERNKAIGLTVFSWLLLVGWSYMNSNI